MIRGAVLAALGAAVLVAGPAGAKRPKLSDLPLAKAPTPPSLTTPSSVTADAKIAGLKVRMGRIQDVPNAELDRGDIEADDLLDSSGGRPVAARKATAVAAVKRPAPDPGWVTVMPTRGCVSQEGGRNPAKSVQLAAGGVIPLELRRIERSKAKTEFVTTYVVVDTKTRGAKVLEVRRTPLRRLGRGAGKFSLYGYRTNKGVELVVWAPGAQIQTAGTSNGSSFSQCGLLETTLSTKRTAASVDIGAERQLPLTKQEKLDAQRGVATQNQIEASFAHVSVSKMGRDRAPVLSVVVRKESGRRFSPPRPPMHGMLR